MSASIKAMREIDLRQILDALESCRPGDYSTGHVIDPSFDEVAVYAAIASLRAALAEGEAEPVCYRSPTGHGIFYREAKDMTPELLALEFAGKKMWRPMYDHPSPAALRAAVIEEVISLCDEQHDKHLIAAIRTLTEKA